MTFRPHLSLCFLAGWIALAAVSPGGAQPADLAPVVQNAPAEDPVGPLILRDESIDQVLALLERWTGKTILRPQALPAATLTLTMNGSVTREEAVRALETLLTLNGIAVTALDDHFLKVTSLASARFEAPELIDGSTLGRAGSGRIASKVFQLNFLRVAEIMPQVSPLLNAGLASPPVIFEKANAALITDTLSTLQRIETLIAQLDKPVLAGLEPRFYPLHFAQASEVVTRMQAMLSGSLQAQVGATTTFSPDDRTNQVILLADARQYPFFDALIARLDVQSDPNTRNQVIYLKHAAAKEVASLLSHLVAGSGHAPAGETSPARTDLSLAPSSSASIAPTVPRDNSMTVASPHGPAAEPANQFSAMLTILPEERTNSLVVSGTVDDLRLIRELVDQIDILLAQVRIEVVIAEVTLRDDATSGISALGLTLVDNKLVGFSGAGAGFRVDDGLINPTTRDLSAVISLGTTPRKTNATILSQPNIITTHNKEGHIFVGESVPVISSYLSDATAGGFGGSGYRSTVTAQDIGIDLTVKPLIGPDGSVQLEIKQQVNDILGEVFIDGNPQPRIGKRATASFVSVQSGEIVVLGGLQRRARSRSTNRLGPIPFLGDLFGTRVRENTRTDLVFFLRPTVLTNTPADNRAALQQVDSLPPAERAAVKKILEPAPVPVP